MPEALEERLEDLAHDLVVRVPDTLEDAVMARVATARPRRRFARWLIGLLLGAVGAGLVASPVGASLREWLGLPGVTVSSGGPVTGTPTVPPATPGGDLEAAADRAGFAPLVPEALGEPDGVEVSADGLVVSLSWSTGTGTVRLDQLRGDIEPLFWKTADRASPTSVSGRDALWLPSAHRVVVVSPDGAVRSLPSRLAAPTLLWVSGELTLRLEGELDLAGARRIAEST